MISEILPSSDFSSIRVFLSIYCLTLYLLCIYFVSQFNRYTGPNFIMDFSINLDSKDLNQQPISPPTASSLNSMYVCHTLSFQSISFSIREETKGQHHSLWLHSRTSPAELSPFLLLKDLKASEGDIKGSFFFFEKEKEVKGVLLYF